MTSKDELQTTSIISHCACGSRQQAELNQAFASGTTCHGFGRMISSKNRLQMAFWMLVIAAAVGLTLWMISLRLISYLEYNTSTEISVDYRVRAEFPAVTICNYNRYLKSQLTDLDRIVTLVASRRITSLITDVAKNRTSIEAIATFFDTPEIERNYNISGIMSREGWTKDQLAKYVTLADMRNLTLNKGWKLDQQGLIFCQFGADHKCTIEDFTHVFTEMGNCYTFNARHKADGTLHQQRRQGSRNGLMVTIDVQQEEYSESLSENGNLEYGLKFQVHDSHDPLDPISRGIGVGTGFLASAAIREEELFNTIPPWGKCNRSATLEHYATYTYHGCSHECEARSIYETCGCKLLHHKGDYPICSSFVGSVCAGTVQLNVADNFDTICSQCKPACKETTFTIAALSYAPIPNSNVAPELNELLNFPKSTLGFRNNIVMLDISFRDLSKSVTRINPAMTFSGLLSDIGGTLGLFIGMSCATLLEFVEIIVMKLIAAFKSRKRKNTEISSSTDQLNNGFSSSRNNQAEMKQF